MSQFRNNWLSRLAIIFLTSFFIFVVYNSFALESDVSIQSVECSTPKQIELKEEKEGDAQICEWKFVRYESSPWETEWINNVKEWAHPSTGNSMCDKMKEKIDLVEKWDKGASDALAGCGGFDDRLLSQSNSEIFSKLWYRNSCTNEEKVSAIEPIVGLIRHPKALCIDNSYLLSREYLVLGLFNPTCSNISDRALTSMNPGTDKRIFLFDLGASLYTSGAGGASQDWFIDAFSKHGYKNVEYYGWEVKKLDPVDVWKQIPDNLKPHYHWINIPANPDPNSGDNPWNFVRDVVTKEDYVMIKLDIDNSPIEAKFMEQIVNDLEFSGLIDEMFFEHHVNVGPMLPYWVTGKETIYLSDSFDLMVGLRRRGIRFHGWP